MNIAIGLGLSAACLAVLGGMVWAVYTAPLGWEDDDGFHEGPEPCSDYDEPVSGRTGRTAPEARSDHPTAAGDI
jgi:hypothetical protein